MTIHTAFGGALADLARTEDEDRLRACLSKTLAHFGFWGVYEGKTSLPLSTRKSYQLLSSNLDERLGERGPDCVGAMARTIESSDPRVWRARMEWANRVARPWSSRELPANLNISPSIDEVFADFGLQANEVLAVPVAAGGDDYHMFGCITDVQPSLGDATSVIALVRFSVCRHQALLANESALEPLALPEKGSDRPRDLSEKQREVLCWAAAGKTLQDIADIIGISRRTVRYHIESARERYGYATSQQTIVRAALDYEFDPLGPSR